MPKKRASIPEAEAPDDMKPQTADMVMISQTASPTPDTQPAELGRDDHILRAAVFEHCHQALGTQTSLPEHSFNLEVSCSAANLLLMHSLLTSRLLCRLTLGWQM